jgi:hypothetical protein
MRRQMRVLWTSLLARNNWLLVCVLAEKKSIAFMFMYVFVYSLIFFI